MKDCAPRPSSLIFAAVFAAAIGRGAFGLADTPRLLFHAPFDGTATAAVAAGNPEPLVANVLEWGCGRLPGTKALRMRGAPSLAYAAAGNLPRESVGGGYYQFDYASNRIILDSSSYDFGKPKWHLLDTLKVPSVYRGLKLVYKYDDNFHDDLNVSEEMKIEYYE